MDIRCGFLKKKHRWDIYEGVEDERGIFMRYRCSGCGKVGSFLSMRGIGAALLAGWSLSKAREKLAPHLKRGCV